MNVFLRLFPVFLTLLWLTGNADAAIQASVDRNPVAVGESFQLTLSSDEEPDQDPELALLMIDFEVLGQQRSSNASWVNGKANRSEQWILRLAAKRSGDLTIPPIQFGKQSSQPLHIKVTDTPSSPQNSSDLFLEVETSPSKPYVQSQVIYTLRVYRSVELVSARLSEPELKDAVVEKLGEDAQYTKLVNGIDYVVIERKYAIFPQQSGQQTIPALNLKADVLSQQAPSFNGFFSRPRTEQKLVNSKPVTLDVQAMPSDFTADNWLSADAMRLEDSWSNNRLQTQVGEPITRTLRLSGQGTTVAQLPELADSAAIDGVKSYPDQPLLTENKQPDGLNAMREEKIAYIASKPGTYALPGKQIKWFNTAKQKVEVLQIAPVTITVTGTADSPSPDAASDQPAQTTTPTTTGDAASESADQQQALLPWQILCAVLTLLWLATLIWALRLRRSTPASTASQTAAPVIKADKTIKRLKAACIANQPQSAKQALLLWGSQQYGVDNLTSLAAHCNPDLAEHIRRLNQQLYAQQPGNWDGYPLWSAFAKQTPVDKAERSAGDDDLEPLHKI